MSVPIIDFTALSVSGIIRTAMLTTTVLTTKDGLNKLCHFELICTNEEHDQLACDFEQWLLNKNN